jgi:hypothetical protein
MITAYFDHSLDSNLFEHSIAPNGSTYWIVAHDRGIAFRDALTNQGVECCVSTEYQQPGVYIVDVNGGPALWTGMSLLSGFKTTNVLDLLPDHVLAGLRDRKIKLVLLAWAEGHRFVVDSVVNKLRPDMYGCNYDAFSEIHSKAKEKSIPIEQIIIVHGNHRVKQEYQQWCQDHSIATRLTVTPGLKFFSIFNPQAKSNSTVLIENAVSNTQARDFNSLNRIVKVHRNDHFYELIARGLLEHGHVSGQLGDYHSPLFIDSDLEQWQSTVRPHFPRHIDIKDFEINPADNFNPWIYENSLLTVITETHFEDDITFLSEKIFKPISAGHPFIVLGNSGTLAVLESLGFKTNFCGLGADYDKITDPLQRFRRVHDLLSYWVNLPRVTKINLICASLPSIRHNFELYRKLDFTKEMIDEIKRLH